MIGSDDFSPEAKRTAALDTNAALKAGWKGHKIAQAPPLSEIAQAHELVERPVKRGRIVLVL